MRSTLPLSHVRRFALGAAAALAMACATLGGERQAAAQIVEVAPPAVRVEVIPPAPPHHFWIAGYWGWHGGRYVWVPGRYERVRPGWAWERAHWAHERHGWRLAGGRWHRR